MLARSPVDLSTARAVPPSPVDLSTEVTFAALERRRKLAGIPVARWIAAAAMDPRTFRKAKEGHPYQRTDKLARLSRALDVLTKGPPPNAIVALVRCAELMLSAELARSKRLASACAGGARLSVKRLRRYAIYLVTVEMLIDNADVARALCCSRQNIKQARDAVDDWREHAAVDAMLDRLAAMLKGVE
jgi:hypothetical protein